MAEHTNTAPRCIRCNRVLRSASAIARGYGRTCWRHIRNAAAVVDLAEWKPEQLAKAGELITDGAIVPLRGRVFLAVSSDGSETYRTATSGQCNCPAGLRTVRARPCYHVAAARIMAAA